MIGVDTNENKYLMEVAYGSKVKKCREWLRSVKQTKEEIIVGRDEFYV